MPTISARPRPEAADRLLSLAIDEIDQAGEAAIRVADIAGRAGVRTASLYKWFGDREGLIIAAQRARYERALEHSIDKFGEIVGSSPDVEHFRASSRALAREISSQERLDVSLDRLNVIGSAVARPALLDDIIRRTHLYQETMAVHLGRAQRNDLIPPGGDPMFLSGWLFTASFGRVMVALGSEIVDTRYWESLFLGASHHVMTGQEMVPPVSIPPYRPSPPPGVDRLHPTARTILDWAVGEIIADGEASMRLSDLTDHLGLAVTAVYQHFGSREGLVRASHAELLRNSYSGKLEMVQQAIAAAHDGDSLRANIRSVVTGAFSQKLNRSRLGRMVALAGSYGRPEVIAMHNEIRDDFYVGVERAFDYAKARGWVPVERDMASTMCWVDGMSIGECLVSLGIIAVDHDQWVETTADAVVAAIS